MRRARPITPSPHHPLTPSPLISVTLLLALTGCGIPSFYVTPVSSSTALKEETVVPGSGGKIALIEVEGMLMNRQAGGFLQPTENDSSLFTQELDKAEKDSEVRAVILRINSPGGTVSASDVLHEQVLAFKKRSKKPVIAACQDIAASGGYYVACAADKIVAQPTSIVGSIGVIFQTFDLSGTLDKVGAKAEAIKSGALKDMGSPFRPMEPAERVVMQQMVDEYHLRFRDIVKAGRSMDDVTLATVTNGRVWSGAKAAELGLVDQTGQLPDAIELARQMGKAPNAEVVIYRRPHGYGGSIYAAGRTPRPQAAANNVDIDISLFPQRAFLPTGFYYLWEPALSWRGGQ